MVMEEDTSSLVNGPDQLVTCNNLITWDPKGSVKIRMERTGKGAMEPISIPGLLMKTARENPHIPALKIREPKTGVEKTWTWTDYHQDVRTVAKAFISLGFARYGWIKNQRFQRNPTFLPPDSTVYAYWASMLLNG